MTNIHKMHHDNYSANGRSPEIEGYAEQSLDWMLSQLDERENRSFLDLGCDYGFSGKHLLETHPKRIRFWHGVDAYYTHDPFDYARCGFIERGDLLDPNVYERLKTTYDNFDVVILQHVLEHIPNPDLFFHLLNRLAPQYLYIAVPDGNLPWANIAGHFTCWTPNWLKYFPTRYGWTLRSYHEATLRDDKRELWAIFE